MELTATLETGAPPEAVFAWVEDLGRYPDWLDIVPGVEPADPDPGDPGPAWHVELRGHLGPMARSKRLRMVRTVHQAPHRAVFERRELDGRSHAAWVLTAEVDEHAGGSALVMHLHYGGGLMGKPLELLLTQEIERSRARLRACLDEPVA